MIKTTAQQLALVLKAQLVCVQNTDEDIEISSVSTDSRNIAEKALFIALIGDHFDGHQFAVTAQKAGAKALLVERRLPLDIAQLIVADTRIALGQLGAWVKAQAQVKTLAITGSCGKTSVKEMSASILSQCGQVLSTHGNFNNDIGVPLTLLRLTPQDQFAVIELGANHPQEIAYTVNLVKPDVAVINNVAAAHLEGFKTLLGVANAKGEIFQGLGKGGTAIYNESILDLYPQHIPQWQDDIKDKQCFTFHLNQLEQTQCYATDISLDTQAKAQFLLHTPQGKIVIKLPIPGEHNVSNALAASMATLAMGASLAQIKKGLETLHMVSGRVNAQMLTSQVRVIDDTYNASASAMKAAAKLLSAYAGKKILVLADMKELGEESVAIHEDLGRYIASLGINKTLTYGKDAQYIAQFCSGEHFTDITLLNEALTGTILRYLEQPQTITILVKGARSMKMERVVTMLKEHIK